MCSIGASMALVLCGLCYLVSVRISKNVHHISCHASVPCAQGLLCLRYILDWKVDTDKVRRKELQELQDVSTKAKEGGTAQSDQTRDTKARYGALDV